MRLLNITLTLSFLGILLLLIIANKPGLTNIENIKLGNRVTIQGKVINIEQKSNDFYIMTIKDHTGKIEVLLNNEIQANNIEVTGKVKQYNNKLQIQAYEIVKKDS